MVERYQPKGNGNYFPAQTLQFIHSGCTVLDCVLGGGWPLGRVVNIVGDKAVGKTLLATEAAANFLMQYPKGKIWYRDVEAAFDPEYAASLGLNISRVEFGPEGTETQWDTIEQIFNDIEKAIQWGVKTEQPGLYVIDSLDALSSEDELKRDVTKGSYSLEKQKILGRLFRDKIRMIRETRICLMFISQLRDRIGITYGEKKTRSGGKSLDYYATQIIWLRYVGKVNQTTGGIKQTVGVKIMAQCKKIKIFGARSFAECGFEILFDYGIDDIGASLNYLDEVKRKTSISLKGIDDDPKRQKLLRSLVQKTWFDVRKGFKPKHRKYGDEGSQRT